MGRIVCWVIGADGSCGVVVHGFKKNRGWEGCLTLPRVLTMRPDGHLGQEPVPEVQMLRGEYHALSNNTVSDSSHVVKDVRGDTLELLAEFSLGDAKIFGLRVRRSDDGRNGVRISYDGKQLDVAGTTAPFGLADSEKFLKLHVFLDKSLIEVYANGRVCLTKVVYPGENDLGLDLFAMGGSMTISSLDVWKMKSIW